MKVFAFALTLICMALMFLVRREYKIAILFMSTILLNPVILPFKGITAIMAISLSFILSEIIKLKYHWKRIRNTVLFPYIILVLLSLIICVITSPHLHNLLDAGYFVLSEILVKMFALVYAFMCFRRKSSIRPLLMLSFIGLIIITVLGYLNYHNGYSFYVDELINDPTINVDTYHTDRFRVQASFISPFDYGYMCVLLALLHLFGYYQSMEGSTRFAIAQLCGLFGVLSCNCRTILFCYLVCALAFFLAIQKQRTHKVLFLSGAFVLSLAAFFLIPSVHRLIVSVFTIFDPASVTKGSSISMRILQLFTVLFYISGPYLFFGRGVHFFERDMGWADGSMMAVDSDLYGLEGVYLNILLERGIVGLAIYLAIIVILVVYIVRHRRLGRYTYALGISIVLLYILFSFMTGELSSATPSFMVLGYVIANQNYREKLLLRRQKHK